MCNGRKYLTGLGSPRGSLCRSQTDPGSLSSSASGNGENNGEIPAMVRACIWTARHAIGRS
jgi:hypothetical protein